MIQQSKKVGYVLPVELIREIKHEAANSDRNASEVVEAACSQYLATRQSYKRKITKSS